MEYRRNGGRGIDVLCDLVLGHGSSMCCRDATERYILCERAAKNLQDGSNYLTEQVRLFAITGQQVYMDNYFAEAADGRREKALGGAAPLF